MNDLQIFNNDEFGEIRTVEIDGEPWFVGKDIAAALGYAKERNAISAHVDVEDKRDAPIQGDLGGTQKMTVINESGLYALVLFSKLPSAKKFKRWVTSEVLPAIRKTGGYQLPQTYAEALRALADKAEEAERLKHENNVLITQNAELQPKANYYNFVLNCNDLIPTSVLAKDYGWSAIKLNRFLADQKIQFKSGGVWLLYQKYAQEGYTSTKTIPYSNKNGEQHSKIHTYWTQAGRLFIYETMKKAGYLPIMEREVKE